jgi:rhamnosyltransferase
MGKCQVSIVVLTKNAGTAFENTLNSVCNQDFDRPYEIVLVDSGSTDDTLNIIKKFDVRLFRIPPDEFNFGLTRNYAFSLTNGDFIVTISQDVVPCSRFWLQYLIDPFCDINIAAVQGSTAVQANTNVFYWEKKGYFYFTSESKNWIEKYNYGLSFVNCAIRRSFWQGHPMGSALFSEDKLFQKTIHDSGMKVYFSDEAVCYHGHQYTLKSLVNRLKNEGIGWKYVDVRYGFIDCLRDIYRNKWLCRKSVHSLFKGDIKTIQELLFPIIRPICIYYGNKKSI